MASRVGSTARRSKTNSRARIQERDVFAEAAGNRIPRPAARIRRQDGDAELIGRCANASQDARAVLRRPMEKDKQWDGAAGRRYRNLEEAVAIATAESKRTALERGLRTDARARR